MLRWWHCRFVFGSRLRLLPFSCNWWTSPPRPGSSSLALSMMFFPFTADDEGNDFACLSAKGKVGRIAARCGHQIMSFESWHVSTIPDESDKIAMHEIASRQFELFTGLVQNMQSLLIGIPSPNRHRSEERKMDLREENPQTRFQRPAPLNR